jgi:hypothetical protein
MNREYAKLNEGRKPGGRVAGFVHFDPQTGKVTKFLLAKEMNIENRLRTYIHELAHVIDHNAGNISTDNLMDELRTVYSTLRNPNRAPGGAEAAGGTRHTPASRGYEGDDIRKEYVAEAIRAYLTNPNYLKAVAPQTAAAIRAAVNAHPEVSRIIQFNSVGGMGLLTIRDMGSAGEESRDDGSL